MLVDSALADAARRTPPQPQSLQSPIDVDAAPTHRVQHPFSPPEARLRTLTTASPPLHARDRTHSTERSPGGNAHRAPHSEFFLHMREEYMSQPPSSTAKRSLALRDIPPASQSGGRNTASLSLAATSLMGSDRAEQAPPTTRDATVTKRVYKSSSDSSDSEAAAELTTANDSSNTKKKRLRTRAPLNFFMDAHQTQSAGPPVTEPTLQPPVCSSRTRICGQVYGRCELRFSARSVELVVWRQPPRPGESEKRAWQGSLQYAKLARFWYVWGRTSARLR